MMKKTISNFFLIQLCIKNYLSNSVLVRMPYIIYDRTTYGLSLYVYMRDREKCTQ